MKVGGILFGLTEVISTPSTEPDFLTLSWGSRRCKALAMPPYLGAVALSFGQAAQVVQGLCDQYLVLQANRAQQVFTLCSSPQGGNYRGSIRDFPDFDPSQDAEALYTAMKGFGGCTVPQHPG